MIDMLPEQIVYQKPIIEHIQSIDMLTNNYGSTENVLKVVGKNFINNVVISFDTKTKLNNLMHKVVKPTKRQTISAKIKKISAFFLATPYKANSMIGSISEKEKLVVNLNEFDCLTYLDYVHALAKTECLDTECFLKELVKTRYKDSLIDYRQRKHFFSDWYTHKKPNAIDISAQITNKFRQAEKMLNLKDDGNKYIVGLPVVKRKITYIPTEVIDQSLVDKIKDGSYIGIYTNKKGLDVTHVGIFVRTDKGDMFRNASTKKANYKVVDQLFLEYIQKVPGIIVLAPQGKS